MASSNRIDEAASIIWDFLRLIQPPEGTCDLMLVAGSHDLRVADHAAHIYKRNPTQYLVVSGGSGKITKDLWQRSEAQVFADRMVALGVPRQSILMEEFATNTGQNITFTRSLLEGIGADVGSGLIITKTYMHRRLIATAEKQWPNPNWFVDSPDLSFSNYANEDCDREMMLSLMVADIKRVQTYHLQGFQTEQQVPHHVERAWKFLCECGFDELPTINKSAPHQIREA